MESQKAIDQIRLSPGDRVRVTTESGTEYDVEAHIVIKGILRSTVIRRPLERPDADIEEQVIEDAAILAPGRVRTIIVGESMELVGVGAANKPVDLRTTPVRQIIQLEDLQEEA
ncbi:MAG: hypothetical protein JWO96_836 [Candidatus Saccharibacteria bacterium]|nr:hypothetical protein [Candidatus Saccharibacteria bacterium]